MTRQGKARFSLVIAAMLTLTACEEGKMPFGLAASDTARSAQPRSSTSSPVAADVEAPDVVQLSGASLWDGRPSLGGVWVAHSSVTDPERVIIRNPANGKSVVGALFRRERDNPGPSVQVSSDAAEALGMLAGQPADLNIVALRRQEPAAPAEEPAILVDEQAATETPLDETATVAELASEVPPETASVAADPTAAAVEEALQTTAAPEKPVRKTGGFFGLFRKKPKNDASLAAPITSGIASGTIEQAPLDPIAGAAAAIDRAEGATPSALKRAYIQIGIYGSAQNADDVVKKMSAAGITGTTLPGESNGKPFWRVVVGPVASVAERDALTTRVKGLGYSDAYPVTN
ncbi:MAG: SPOR domain-containing protein [Albidovulum sp.]